MRAYLDLLAHVLEHGEDRTDRTGTGTRGIFGHQLRFDLADGFPLVTTKKVHLRSIINELLWFLHGRTDNQWLNERNVSIWNEWATPEACAKRGQDAGDLGPVYGYQWRHFGAEYPDRESGVDQIRWIVDEIKRNPDSRRLVVSAWNPKDIPQMALPPCHALFQFSVRGERLDCQLYQRSADLFLGVPFNIASYSLLLMMVAQVTGLKPGTFVHTFGDAHIYQNHFEQVKTQLSREPRPLPIMRLDPSVTDLFAFTYESFTLEGYDPHPRISAPVAV